MTPSVRLAASWAAFKLAGSTVAASWTPSQMGAAAVAADVMLDAPGTIVIDDVVATEPSVTFRASDWPAVRTGDRITVGAAIYEAREVLPVGDGLVHRATIRRIN